MRTEVETGVILSQAKEAWSTKTHKRQDRILLINFKRRVALPTLTLDLLFWATRSVVICCSGPSTPQSLPESGNTALRVSSSSSGPGCVCRSGDGEGLAWAAENQGSPQPSSTLLCPGELPACACGEQEQRWPGHTTNTAKASGCRSVRGKWAGYTLHPCVALAHEMWQVGGWSGSARGDSADGGIYGRCLHVGEDKAFVSACGGISMWEADTCLCS